jgi:DNA-binding response OmpR family regulator
MKILIIDDQQLVLLPLERHLTKLGYEIRMAENVFDAIAAYDDFTPDLVITDINMPVLPSGDAVSPTDINDKAAGLEIVKYIRSIKGSSLPIMVLSGNTEENIIKRSFEMGINEYMKKPLLLKEIGTRVKRLLSDGLKPHFAPYGHLRLIV